MLALDQTCLAVVDVQGKLAQLMHDKEALFRNLQIVVEGAKILGLPILWCEQNPAGLGPTIPEIAHLLTGQKPIAKMTFSCAGNPEFMEELRATKRKQVLLAGIEAHVCIYLTAAELVTAGFEVQVIADAVSSRSLDNKQIGLARCGALSAGITCTETVLFELMRTAERPEFKKVVKLLK